MPRLPDRPRDAADGTKISSTGVNTMTDILAKVLAAGVVAAAAVLVPAAPARAVNTCGEAQRVEYPTPGFNTVLQVRICITHGSPARGAYATLSWIDGGDGGRDNNRKFDALAIHYGLVSTHQEVASGTCELAHRVNRAENGTFTCDPAFLTATRTGSWKATGYITYDLDRDGAGLMRTDLKPSPVVDD
jgi:hypothetical protein